MPPPVFRFQVYHLFDHFFQHIVFCLRIGQRIVCFEQFLNLRDDLHASDLSLLAGRNFGAERGAVFLILPDALGQIAMEVARNRTRPGMSHWQPCANACVG